jgi:hypothetical protein
VAPQIEGRERLLATRDQAERRLREMLVRAGVERVERAEAQLREKQRLQAEATLAEQQARIATHAALPGIDGAEGLRVEIERRRGSIESERAALQVERPPDRGEVERQLTALETEIVRLDHGLREAAGLLEGARRGREQHLSAQGRATEAARQAQADLEARAGELELAARERPAAELKEAATDAAARLEDRRQALAELHERAAGASLNMIESELGRIDQAIEQRRADRGDLRERVAALRSGIEKDEGAGLDEQTEELARRLELRERERAGCEREIKALRLLLEILDDAERAAKQLYLQPVVDRLRPYVRGLFPGADVSLDDSLKIKALCRESGGEEPFGQLSDGTREQIAVLARLAFAEMLADQDLPAVLVLDDALAFADDQRLNQMFNVLHHAARRVQIVVFTCRERLFENLGATRLRLLDAAQSAAAAE